MLTTENLSKHYGRFNALSGLNTRILRAVSAPGARSS